MADVVAYYRELLGMLAGMTYADGSRVLTDGQAEAVAFTLYADGDLIHRLAAHLTLPPLQRGSLEWRLVEFTDQELELELQRRPGGAQ